MLCGDYTISHVRGENCYLGCYKVGETTVSLINTDNCIVYWPFFYYRISWMKHQMGWRLQPDCRNNWIGKRKLLMHLGRKVGSY